MSTYSVRVQHMHMFVRVHMCAYMCCVCLMLDCIVEYIYFLRCLVHYSHTTSSKQILLAYSA
jgi:hypothetical protein